jgi:RecJ-like exonuclease
MAKQQKPILYCDDGGELELPTKWEICSWCDGHGTDRGASVECDGGGFTASEWAEQDDDFREGYLRGDYDRACEGCGGSGKVMVADYSRMSPDEIKKYDAQLREDADYRSLCAAERRMGA